MTPELSFIALGVTISNVAFLLTAALIRSDHINTWSIAAAQLFLTAIWATLSYFS